MASTLARPTTAMAFRYAQSTKGNNAHKVPRVYIKTLKDRVIELRQQDIMITKWSPSQVFNIFLQPAYFFWLSG